jgi:ABC-type nitrate/sulfonate/bicarbonate transport system permease component
MNEQFVLHRMLLWHLKAIPAGCVRTMVVSFAQAVLLDFLPGAVPALFPIFLISWILPLVVIAPLVALCSSFDPTRRILPVARVTLFPMLVTRVHGLEATDPGTEALLRSMGASRRRVFRRARLPVAAPVSFGGLRISITHAVVINPPLFELSALVQCFCLRWVHAEERRGCAGYRGSERVFRPHACSGFHFAAYGAG